MAKEITQVLICKSIVKDKQGVESVLVEVKYGISDGELSAEKKKEVVLSSQAKEDTAAEIEAVKIAIEVDEGIA